MLLKEVSSDPFRKKKKKLEEMATFQDKQQVKSHSTFLWELDFAKGSEKGDLALPTPELKPFLCELDTKVWEQINTKTQKRYRKQLLKIVEDSLLSDLQLEKSLDEHVAALCTKTPAPDMHMVKSLYKELIKNYLHAREGKYT